jgi:hypothetical protein
LIEVPLVEKEGPGEILQIPLHPPFQRGNNIFIARIPPVLCLKSNGIVITHTKAPKTKKRPGGAAGPFADDFRIDYKFLKFSMALKTRA